MEKIYRSHVLVCAGAGCVSSGCQEVAEALVREISKHKLEDEIKVVQTGCIGSCDLGPVIVVSPRPHGQTHLVVPLSTTRPRVPGRFHVRIPAGRYSFLSPSQDMWAKCDLIAAVAPRRLGLLRAPGRSRAPTIESSDFRAIQRGILHALGLASLTPRV